MKQSEANIHATLAENLPLKISQSGDAKTWWRAEVRVFIGVFRLDA